MTARRMILLTALSLLACGDPATPDDAGAGLDGGPAPDAASASDAATPMDAAIGDAGSDAISADCYRFCAGGLPCLESDCPLGMPAADYLRDCVTICRDIALTMTSAELEDTVTCLDCMDVEVEQEACTIMMVATAEMTCNMTSTCAEAGPRRLLSEFTDRIDGPTRFDCP